MISTKNIAIGVAVLIIVGSAFLFRSQISDILTFGTGVNKPDDKTVADKPADTKEKAPGKNSANVSQQEPKPTSQNTKPVYSGRDPQEVRPVPAEVKIFSEEQKQKLYSSIQTYGRQLKENPDYFNGWIELGLLKKTIGDFEGAADAWEYASAIQPMNSLSFANLGELYWRYLHLYAKAEENLKTSIAHKPDDIQTYITLAELYHYSMPEKYNLAPGVLIAGLNANPGDGSLMRRLAYIYELRREYAKAIDWWQKVLDINQGDQEVMDSINKDKARLGTQ